MPDAPISQPRRTDREGRKANAEQFALSGTTVPKPVTRRAQSMGNLIAVSNWKVQMKRLFSEVKGWLRDAVVHPLGFT